MVAVGTHDVYIAPFDDHVDHSTRDQVPIFAQARRAAQIHFDLWSCEDQDDSDRRIALKSHLPLPLGRRKAVPPRGRTRFGDHLVDSSQVAFVVHALNHVL